MDIPKHTHKTSVVNITELVNELQNRYFLTEQHHYYKTRLLNKTRSNTLDSTIGKTYNGSFILYNIIYPIYTSQSSEDSHYNL